MKNEQADRLDWFKSSYSGGDGGECVEIAAPAATVRIWDSKESGGPQLAFTRAAWVGLVTEVGRSRST
ncbi:DUF397 domain-containing protein [Streptomyces sp. NPDC002454]